MRRCTTSVATDRQLPVDKVSNDIGSTIVRGTLAQLSETHDICDSGQSVCHSSERDKLFLGWLSLIIVSQDCSARDVVASSFLGGYDVLSSPSMDSRKALVRGYTWLAGGDFSIVADGVLRTRSLVFC